MADEYEDEYEDEQDNQDIRNLRKAAKERDALQAQLRERDRELAFARAKIDLDDPRMKYFVKGYDGELTPEAVRAKAEEDGFLPKSQTPPDVTAQQRIASASSGASETPNTDLEDAIRAAGSQEEVMNLMAKAGYPTSWDHA